MGLACWDISSCYRLALTFRFADMVALSVAAAVAVAAAERQRALDEV
jgi:hypothetical protein